MQLPSVCDMALEEIGKKDRNKDVIKACIGSYPSRLVSSDVSWNVQLFRGLSYRIKVQKLLKDRREQVVESNAFESKGFLLHFKPIILLSVRAATISHRSAGRIPRSDSDSVTYAEQKL
jgi:hypothetical protein